MTGLRYSVVLTLHHEVARCIGLKRMRPFPMNQGIQRVLRAGFSLRLCDTGGVMEIFEHLLEDFIALYLRREQTLHVLHDENRGLMYCKDAQVLSVQVDAMIGRRNAAVARTAHYREGLTWRASAKDPGGGGSKCATDTPVHLFRFDCSEFSSPGLLIGCVGSLRKTLEQFRSGNLAPNVRIVICRCFPTGKVMKEAPECQRLMSPGLHLN